jgi:hypothetical protein
MMLHELLPLLATEASECDAFESVVLCKPRNDDGSYGPDAESYPIVDVAVDEADRDVDLVCADAIEDSSHGGTSLTVGAVTSRLQAIASSCREWGVYAGAPTTPIDSEWNIRLDVPIVGIAVNRSERLVAFLQGPREQWGAAA